MTNQLIKKIKRQIVLTAHSAQEGHIPSAYSILDLICGMLHIGGDLSVADIMIGLWKYKLTYDPKRPKWEGRDRFILSKGHASLALYAVLAEKGYFPIEKLDSFCRYNSDIGGHPDCNKIPGVEASTGSLGHGFPMAVGIALGSKIRKFNNRIFCLIGDGECNEGTVWESAMLASHHQLSNLCCIVDYNHSTDRALNLGDIGAKFRSFGWEVLMISGHDHKEINHALSNISPLKPLAIIAQTTKGKGVKCMENEPAWHHRSVNDEELSSIIEELA